MYKISHLKEVGRRREILKLILYFIIHFRFTIHKHSTQEITLTTLEIFNLVCTMY